MIRRAGSRVFPSVRASTVQRRRLIFSAVLSFPVLAMSMIPALQFDYWQWLVLNMTTPVILWGAWPFHRAAWANLKHATATMDTLISLGTLTAFLWSLFADTKDGIAWPWETMDRLYGLLMPGDVHVIVARLHIRGVRDASNTLLDGLVELAAEGRSNPEIAQALFVTRKTVETHLGHVYRKLEIAGRGELPRALAPEQR